MTLLSRMEIIDIVRQIKDPNCIKGTNKLLKKLECGVLDPEISNYIYYSEMTPEEIADKALAYKPIYL